MLPASNAERGPQTTMEEKESPAAGTVAKVPQTYVDGKFVAPPPAVLRPQIALPPPASLTLEEAKSRIEEFTDNFRHSHRMRSLDYLFEQGQNAKITTCICLHVGHFLHVTHVSTRSAEVKFNTALHQLAMLELILKLLAKGSTVQVYFQDVGFTDPERRFLQSCGYTVLPDDTIFSRMSTTTFLFAPFRTKVSVPKALAHSFPALYIGVDLLRDVKATDSREDEEGFLEGKKREMEALQGFKRVSLETARLPIFAFRVKNGVEKWGAARVLWTVKKKNEVGKEDDNKGKKASRSMLLSTDKEKQKGKRREIAEVKEKEKENPKENPNANANAKAKEKDQDQDQDKEKKKSKDIDWWNYDPPKEH